MTVSLIIATYNWKEALSLTLKSVFSQTIHPDEILIADDGSREDTRQLIDAMRNETTIPIIHVWHEDEGFRKTMILNKTIAKVKGDYIIQVDGDTILNKYFIQDHIEIAEENCFVCGSRVKIAPLTTNFILKGKPYDFRFYKQSHRSMFNCFRSRILRNFLSRRFAKNNIERLRGSNMAFWKKDLIEINGYNENLTSWGHEDTEIAFRLHFAGKQKLFLKMGAIQFHLYHKPSSRANEKVHNNVLDELKHSKQFWTENGLNKYLK